MIENLQRRIQELVATREPPRLGPGPRPGVRPVAKLEIELKSLVDDPRLSVASHDLIRAMVLLWHDHLEAAHAISQGIGNPDGSLVHAIMHRREPDYANSKYWWRRVGEHPCFPELGNRVAALLESRSEREWVATLVPRGRWDAMAFVDACAAAGNLPATAKSVPLLREVQCLELNVALEHFVAGQML